MRRPAFLEYKDYRFLKLATVLAAVAILAYWATKPAGGSAYGGTGFGYVSGIAAALLVILLAWYGVRKRSTPRVQERRKGDRRKLIVAVESETPVRKGKDRREMRAEDSWRYGGTLQGWLSAHAYLGLLLVVLTSLHAGFRFSWNLHTLSYLLALLVVASGCYGAFAYLRYPRLMAENIGDERLSDLLLKISELDELARIRALDLPDEVNALVANARLTTRIGGNFLQQIRGGQRACPTDFAVHRVQALGKELVDGDQPRLIRDVYAVLLQKQRLVATARNEVRLNARMQFWLYLHVPLSVGLLATIFAHVMTILVYW